MADEKKDFTVNDKRRFGSDTHKDKPDKEAADKENVSNGTEDKLGTNLSERQKKILKEQAEKFEEMGKGGEQFPKIDFSTFILSLNSSALFQLGLIEDPSSGEKQKNLPIARQTIDILGMLQEKTQGNLTADEEQMLKNILYDLRIMYVRESG